MNTAQPTWDLVTSIRVVRSHIIHEPRPAYLAGGPCNSPEAAARAARAAMGDPATEEFWALILDGRHRLTGAYRVSSGTLTSAAVHPREVFAPALRVGNVAGLIVAHNHPSGDPQPSAADLDVTRRLDSAGVILGIPLLDHVILGDGTSFTSLADRGMITGASA